MNSMMIILTVLALYAYLLTCKYFAGIYKVYASEAAEITISDDNTSDADLASVPFFYGLAGNFLFAIAIFIAVPFVVWNLKKNERRKAKHSDSYVEFQEACFKYAMASNPITMIITVLWSGIWVGLANGWRYLLLAFAISASPCYAMDIPSAMARVVSMPQHMISRICHR